MADARRGVAPARLRAAAVILGGLLVWAPEARAHGQVPNLVKYCNAKHGEPTVLDLRKWQVEYDVKNRRWLCVKPEAWGVNTSIPARRVPIDVPDVCWTQFRTSQTHFHAGSNVKSSASVHCGITEGTVGAAAPSAPRQPESVLKLCNTSASPELHAALAYWDLDPSRGPGWTSEGWYTLGRNQCRDLALGPYQGDVYVYAETTSGAWDAPEAQSSFCIRRSQSFEIPRSDAAECEGDRQRVRMIKFPIKPGVNRWSFK